MSSLRRYARLLGYLLLGVVTSYGVYCFLMGDRDAAVGLWNEKGPGLLAAVILAAIDLVLEGVCWMWVYSRLGIFAWGLKGAAVYLSGHAGLLLPMQSGRLVRLDSVTRLGMGSLIDGLKSEAVVLFLDMTAAVAVLAGISVALFEPLAGLPVAVATVILFLLLTDRISMLLSGTRIAVPSTFWWKGQTAALLVLFSLGWLLNGLALYVIVFDLTPRISALETIAVASLSRIIGAGSGLPGGIGVSESILGACLVLMEVPKEHLLLSVGFYRIATFWILLPLGWIALLEVNRRVSGKAGEGTKTTREPI